MKTQTELKPTPTDRKLLRNICLKLASTSLVLSAAIIIIIALIWISLFKSILSFGMSLDFSTYDFFGEQASTLAQSINPYFWWLICLVATFIVIRIIIAIIRAIINNSNYKIVDDNSFNQLCNQLSTPALDVLMWAWSDTDEPLKLGDLKLARKELINNKAQRLYKAQEQITKIKQARAKNDIAEDLTT